MWAFTAILVLRGDGVVDQVASESRLGGRLKIEWRWIGLHSPHFGANGPRFRFHPHKAFMMATIVVWH